MPAPNPPPEHTSVLRSACADEAEWTVLCRLLGGNPDTAERLLDAAEASNFGLSDWVGALLAFDAWLTAKAIAARPVETMIGYVECCALSLPQTLPEPDLADLTREMLDRYGFDATREIS